MTFNLFFYEVFKAKGVYMLSNIIKIRQLFFIWLVEKIQPDGLSYYGNFKGTTSALLLFIKNILRPLRVFNRYRHRQSLFGKNRRDYNSILQTIDDEQFFLNKIDFEVKLKEFKYSGICSLECYFPKEMCDKILGSIDEDFNSYPQADEYFTLKNGIQLTPELLEIWVNPTLIKLMSRYLKHSVFARNYPNFHQINPPFTNPATKDMESAKDYGLNVGWHFDTVNLLLIIVLLKDIDKDDSVMQVLSGSHLNHHVHLTQADFNISDEHIASSSYDVKNLDGKAGSIYLVDTNAYHRLYAAKDSVRKAIHFEFTPGQNILMNVKNIAKALRENPDILDELQKSQRNLLLGLFPKAHNYGYTLTSKNSFKNSIYRC